MLSMPCAGALAGPQLVVYESPYYTIHTDIEPKRVREVKLRLTKMAEAYDRRTRGFVGKIRRKFPFFLYRRTEDYLAAGGLPGSAGFYDGDKLMGVAGERSTRETWRIIQHEGFHQFVHKVIGGEVPTWTNEGLAEYFGEAIFTGDDYITGLIPPPRLARIKRLMRENRFKPLAQMMKVSGLQWRQRLAAENYDQAWSMVQFLAHGDNGRYAKPFEAFLQEAGRTGAWERAWLKHFGPGTRDFEVKWRAYWMGLPPRPTADRYAQATVAVLTSFLARAVSQGQSFESFEAFIGAANAGMLKAHEEDWLPPRLLRRALDELADVGKWTVERADSPSPRLVCVTPEGARITGAFVVRKGRVVSVSTEVKAAP